MGIYGGFHSHRGTPIAAWFINPSKMDGLGVPPFQENTTSRLEVSEHDKYSQNHGLQKQW